MNKFIFEYHWCIPHEAQGVNTIPFEYESKIKFQCDMFDEIKKAKKEDRCVNILGNGVPTYEFEDLEKQIEFHIYSLKEWFEKNKFSHTPI